MKFTVIIFFLTYRQQKLVFPGGMVVKNLPANARDSASILGSGRSWEEGNGNPLQYSWLGNSINRGAWWATSHGVTRSQTTLSHWAFTNTHRGLRPYRINTWINILKKIEPIEIALPLFLQLTQTHLLFFVFCFFLSPLRM